MKRRLLSRWFFLGQAPRVLCALALTLVAGAAQAYLTPNVWVSSWASSQQTWSTFRNTHHLTVPPEGDSVPDANSQAQALPRASAASLNIDNAFSTTKGVMHLVSYYPADMRQEAVKTFENIIIAFNKNVPQTYGIPVNNMATGLVAIMVGSYAAYTNQPFPEEAVKPLFRQMRQTMLSTSTLAQASMEEKTAQYQEWVGVGAFLLGWQTQLAKHPDPAQQAQMHKAGADILHALGIDPGKVRFTARGMELR